MVDSLPPDAVTEASPSSPLAATAPAPVPTVPDASQPSAPGPAPEERARSGPQAAFNELRSSVDGLRVDMRDVADFVQRCRERILRTEDEIRESAVRDLTNSLFRLHDTVFGHVSAMEAGEVGPNQFLVNLLQQIEAELKQCGFAVIRPDIGDQFDPMHMVSAGSRPKPFWRRAERVARVHSCGFATNGETSRLLRKATVTVYT